MSVFSVIAIFSEISILYLISVFLFFGFWWVLSEMYLSSVGHGLINRLLVATDSIFQARMTSSFHNSLFFPYLAFLWLIFYLVVFTIGTPWPLISGSFLF